MRFSIIDFIFEIAGLFELFGQHKEERNRSATDLSGNSNSRLPVNWPVILESFLSRISKMKFILKAPLIRISEQHKIQID